MRGIQNMDKKDVKLYATILAHGPMTVTDLASLTGLPRVTVWRRLRRLAALRAVYLVRTKRLLWVFPP